MLMIGSAIGTVVLVAIAIATIVHMSSETPTDKDQVAVADPELDDDGTTDEQDEASPTVSPLKDSTPESTDPTEKPSEFLDDTPVGAQLPIDQNNAIGAAPPIDLQNSGASGFEAPKLGVVNPPPSNGFPTRPEPNP